MKPRAYQLCQEIRKRHPGFRLVGKDESFLMWLLEFCLWPICRDFMSRYVTTIGQVVYVPPGLLDSDDLYPVLRHEEVHIKQWRRWWILFWLGYVLVLPSVLTLRAYWELEAYRESLRVFMEDSLYKPGGAEFTLACGAEISTIAGHFTGPAYGWMFPFQRPVERALWRSVKRFVEVHGTV